MHEDLGQKLVDAGLITEGVLAKAFQQQKSMGESITGSLVKIGALTEDALLAFLSQHFAARPVDLRNYEPDPALTRLIPGDVATKFMALPIRRTGRKLVVAMANPSNIFAIDDIKFITGFEVEPHVATEAGAQARDRPRLRLGRHHGRRDEGDGGRAVVSSRRRTPRPTTSRRRTRRRSSSW